MHSDPYVVAYARHTERATGGGIAQLALVLEESGLIQPHKTRNDETRLSLYERAKPIITQAIPQNDEFVNMSRYRRYTIAVGDLKYEEFVKLLEELRRAGVGVETDDGTGVTDFLDSLVARTSIPINHTETRK